MPLNRPTIQDRFQASTSNRIEPAVLGGESGRLSEAGAQTGLALIRAAIALCIVIEVVNWPVALTRQRLRRVLHAASHGC